MKSVILLLRFLKLLRLWHLRISWCPLLVTTLTSMLIHLWFMNTQKNFLNWQLLSILNGLAVCRRLWPWILWDSLIALNLVVKRAILLNGLESLPLVWLSKTSDKMLYILNILVLWIEQLLHFWIQLIILSSSSALSESEIYKLLILDGRNKRLLLSLSFRRWWLQCTRWSVWHQLGLHTFFIIMGLFFQFQVGGGYLLWRWDRV